jgi:hypothetical protein
MLTVALSLSAIEPALGLVHIAKQFNLKTDLGTEKERVHLLDRP